LAASEQRYEREREFHNQENERWNAVEKFYATAAGARSRYKELLLGGATEGSKVLEYGCGEGGYAFDLAGRGSSVTGIDISEVRIEHARARADGLPGLSFEVMNAERLEFRDDTFDVICGAAILHHLDLDRALAEVARTLRGSGEALFLEPLGHNPFINLYRRLTPAYRTPDEHPLLMRDLRLMSRYFGSVQADYFHLTVLLASPLSRSRGGRTTARALDRVDDVLLRMPFLRRFAWLVVLTLRDPKKNGPADDRRPSGQGEQRAAPESPVDSTST
jgi:ubiquinone/menaquinone biosynthesis C-methylase UbiE